MDFGENPMDFDIRKFEEYRENNRLEVKKAEGGLPVNMWDTYSSFANSYGGVILLGVGERQDGSFYTTGLKNEQKKQAEKTSRKSKQKKQAEKASRKNKRKRKDPGK